MAQGLHTSLPHRAALAPSASELQAVAVVRVFVALVALPWTCPRAGGPRLAASLPAGSMPLLAHRCRCCRRPAGQHNPYWGLFDKHPHLQTAPTDTHSLPTWACSCPPHPWPAPRLAAWCRCCRCPIGQHNPYWGLFDKHPHLRAAQRQGCPPPLPHSALPLAPTALPAAHNCAHSSARFLFTSDPPL